MKRVLVLGFGPFGRVPVNPSDLLVRALEAGPSPAPPGTDVFYEVLPVTWEVLHSRVPALLKALQPDLTLGFGVGAPSGTYRIETVARNRATMKRPDASGAYPDGPTLVPGSPEHITAPYPAKALATAFAQAGMPVALSGNAGSYLCNGLLYVTSQDAEARGAMAGFIHLPPQKETDRPHAQTLTVGREALAWLTRRAAVLS